MKSSQSLPKGPARRKLYTVEEANASLPLVRAIVADLVELSRELVERRHRLSALSAGRRSKSQDLYHEELTQIEEEVRKDDRRLQEYVAELRALGIEPGAGAEGLVDFPALIEGRRACLCWKLGEPDVRYWHEVDAGFRQRRLLKT